MLSFQELLASGRHLGVQPDTLTSLLRIMEDPLVAAGELLPIVETDPGLTAALLKLANSSHYGARRQIGSVRDALVLLGNRTFARLAFLAGVDRMVQEDLGAYQLTSAEIRTHGLAVGVAAAKLAEQSGLHESKLPAFTAGILHDCGKVLLDPHLQGRVLDEARAARGRLDPALEVAFTGYDHGRAGAGLLAAWGLPQSVVQAIRCHHRPGGAGDYRPLASVVWAADTVVHLASDGAVLDPDDPGSPYRLFLEQGLEPELIQDMIDSLPAEQSELAALAATC